MTTKNVFYTLFFTLLAIASTVSQNKLNKKTSKPTFLISKVPNDFYFQIDSGANDSYDSKTGKFTRIYTTGCKSIKIELTENEINTIYKNIIDSDFFKIPDVYDNKIKQKPKCTQNSEMSISVNLNNNFKSIWFRSYYTKDENEMKKNDLRGELLVNLYFKIWKILENKNEVKNLEASDIYYE